MLLAITIETFEEWLSVYGPTAISIFSSLATIILAFSKLNNAATNSIKSQNALKTEVTNCFKKAKENYDEAKIQTKAIKDYISTSQEEIAALKAQNEQLKVYCEQQQSEMEQLKAIIVNKEQ